LEQIYDRRVVTEGEQCEQAQTRSRCSSSSLTNLIVTPLRQGACVPKLVNRNYFYESQILTNPKKYCKVGYPPLCNPDRIVSVALMEKNRNKGPRAQRRAQKKRQRVGLFVVVGLVVLSLGALVFYGADRAIEAVLRADVDEGVERVDDPTGTEAPELVTDTGTDPEPEVAQEEVAQEEVAEFERDLLEEDLAAKAEEAEDDGNAVPVAPGDPTMYMSIPKLGISRAIVADGEAGLELGAMHLAGTGYPWLPGSNTFIAGHRVGFPGTGSDRIFYSLPSMGQGDEIILEDSVGQVYTYRVSEVFAVSPYDMGVIEPVGRDVVTLQVCTETPDDWWTIGPGLMEGGPTSGRLMVRGDLV
jgi:sortase A